MTHSLLGGVPLGITLVLIALIWGVGKNRKGPHPATYKMSDPSGRTNRSCGLPTSPTATDTAIPLTIGGGASGKW